MKQNFIYTTFFILLLQNSFSQTVALDPTFGIGGKVVTSISLGNDAIRKIVLLNNNQILAVGDSSDEEENRQTFIVKFNINGSIDSSFGTNGIVLIANTIFDQGSCQISLLDDGKMLINGIKRVNAGNYRTNIVKLNSNGNLDVTFGTNGVLVAKDFALKNSSSLIIDENGKILIAGQAYNEIDFLSDFWIRRFTIDGTIDNSFGLNGEVIVDFGNQAMNIQSDDQLTTIELQGSKVLLVGQSENDEQANFIMARLNDDGNLDGTFGIDGKVMTDFGGNDIPQNILVLESNEIILSGVSGFNSDNNQKIIFSKYSTTGNLVESFGTNGKVVSQINMVNQYDGIFKMIEKDTKLYGFGFSLDTTYDYLIVRYNSDGSLDSTLENQGYLTTDFSNNIDLLSSVIIKDNSIFCAGSTFSTSSSSFDISMSKFTIGELSTSNFSKSKFSVYPNPFSDIITIEAKDFSILNGTANLYDISGRNLSCYDIKSSSVFTIAMKNSLAKGSYYLKITSGLKTETVKIVKQ